MLTAPRPSNELSLLLDSVVLPALLERFFAERQREVREPVRPTTAATDRHPSV